MLPCVGLLCRCVVLEKAREVERRDVAATSTKKRLRPVTGEWFTLVVNAIGTRPTVFACAKLGGSSGQAPEILAYCSFLSEVFFRLLSSDSKMNTQAFFSKRSAMGRSSRLSEFVVLNSSPFL